MARCVMRYSPDSKLRRKRNIPSDVRTQGKDEAANWIEKHVVEKDRWPMPKKTMAEESGWSRQHISNVLDQYFDVIEPGEELKAKPAGGSDSSSTDTVVTISVDELADLKQEAYREGFQDGAGLSS